MSFPDKSTNELQNTYDEESFLWILFFKGLSKFVNESVGAITFCAFISWKPFQNLLIQEWFRVAFDAIYDNMIQLKHKDKKIIFFSRYQRYNIHVYGWY